MSRRFARRTSRAPLPPPSLRGANAKQSMPRHNSCDGLLRSQALLAMTTSSTITRTSTMASIHKDIIIDASPDDVWDAVRDFGALHTRLVPGFVARHQARRRRAHRDLRQRHGGARAAGRLRRRAAAAGLCHRQRTRQAAQRLGAGDRRRRRTAAGWSGSSTCCRNEIAPYIDAQMDQGALAMQKALGRSAA